MPDIPLVTIAIPTYNRSHTLRRILEALALEDGAAFRILVSDDCSPDDTEAVVAPFLARLPHLRYHRNGKNLGFSGNVCLLYEMAETPYVWFFCDDDTVLPGSVASVVAALRKHRPGVAIFNHRWRDPYGRERLAVPETACSLHEDSRTLRNYQPLLRMTFLSTLVVEKLSGVTDIIRRTDYQDNVFFQVTLGLLVLSERPKLLEAGEVVLYRNVGYKYGEFFKFYFIDVLKAAYAVEHAFDNRKFIRRMQEEIGVGLRLYLSQKLGIFSYAQKPTADTLRKLRQYYGLSAYVIRLFPLLKAVMPSAFLKALYLVQLMALYGPAAGRRVYRENLGRASRDGRKTEFMNYK